MSVAARACHVHGHFVAKDNRRPAFTLEQAMEAPRRDVQRMALAPATFLHEHEKIEQRWPAAMAYVREQRMNEFLGSTSGRVGLMVQGGLYNNLMRALELLGPAPSPEDLLIRATGAAPAEVAAALLALELDGRVTRHPGGLISLAA